PRTMRRGRPCARTRPLHLPSSSHPPLQVSGQACAIARRRGDMARRGVAIGRARRIMAMDLPEDLRMTPRWYFDFVSPFSYLHWQKMRPLVEAGRVEAVPIVFGAV